MDAGCKCDGLLKRVENFIRSKGNDLKMSWEIGGDGARECMDEIIVKVEDYLSDGYKNRCGCYAGRKLSKIQTLLEPYQQNKKDAGVSGGEHFIQMTKQGAYTEMMQIIDGGGLQ